MTKRKLAYIWSLRNAAADKAGQQVAYKGELRYMKSPLEFLAESLNRTALGDAYELVGVIYDDDPELPRDQQKIEDYGFAYRPGQQWFYPAELEVQGRRMNDLLLNVPSTYRRHPRGS
ncbi:N(5)-hydroxyornithine transformylase PvdF, partial [Pseudomonas aeruginosa]|nr:N(5)-hydroxyornithine transformylase PvdF [Pseudomonas aeruginosa]